MIIIVYFYMPSFLQAQFGFDRGGVFTDNAAALLLLGLACPVWGRIADRIGHAATLGAGAVGVTALLLLFFARLDGMAADPGQLLWWYLGFSLFMSTAAVIPV